VPRSSAGLRAIALFKLAKSALLVAAAIGAFRLLHRDIESVALHWLQILQADPNNRYIHALLVRIGAMNAHTLRELSIGSFFYAAVLLLEGIGLWLRRRWAEYLTVIATSALVPLELYEIARHMTLAKGIVLLVNMAIVWYLLTLLRRKKRPASRTASGRPDPRS
jgi:uncharacterized membrane protein (DUF2068 family)